MKQCPVCEKTFEDNMRFCQADGTPLEDKVESVDPFKTMVASKEEIAAAISSKPAEPSVPATPEPVAPATSEPAVPVPIENEVLEIPPAADPNKTQFVSEAELRAEMAAHEAEEQIIDVPAADEVPEPPAFTAPDATPPPSPFAAPNESAEEVGPANFPTSPPIPSPFSAKPPVATLEPEGEESPESPTPAFEEPPAESEPAVNPFEAAPSAPLAQAEFNPPVNQESNMQNPQDFGQNAQFTPPPAGGGQNQTLAIVALVLGILGLTICCGSFIISLAAVITGFMARGKANSDPANYGGAGLALGGLITGALGLIGSVILWIVYFIYAAAIFANMK